MTTLLLLAALLFAPDAPAAAPSPATLRVATFNIRFDNPKDGDDQWSKRTDIVFGVIRKMDPDLMGCQEVLSHQYDAMAKALPEYESVFAARDDGKRGGEGVPVFYRAKRFEKLAEGHFWLSETPDKVASKGWDARLPRITTWVRLKDRSTDGMVLFVNTHFDHIGVTARQESAELLRSQIEKLREGAEVVLTGDFNADEDGKAYANLVSKAEGDSQLVDAFRVVHPERAMDEGSFNGFKGYKDGSRIDWILHSTGLIPVSCEIERFSKDGRYPSDHFPVSAVLSCQKK